MPDIDIRPAAAQMAGVRENIPDDAFDRETPCEGLTLGHLVGHVHGLPPRCSPSSARKELGPDDRHPTSSRTTPTSDRLAEAGRRAPDGTRRGLAGRRPWDGMTQAGGVDLPGSVAAAGARRAGRPRLGRGSVPPAGRFEPDDGHVREIEATIQQFRGDNTGEVPGLFGPTVAVPANATASSSAYSASPVETPPGRHDYGPYCSPRLSSAQASVRPPTPANRGPKYLASDGLRTRVRLWPVSRSA